VPRHLGLAVVCGDEGSCPKYRDEKKATWEAAFGPGQRKVFDMRIAAGTKLPIKGKTTYSPTHPSQTSALMEVLTSDTKLAWADQCEELERAEVQCSREEEGVDRGIEVSYSIDKNGMLFITAATVVGRREVSVGTTTYLPKDSKEIERLRKLMANKSFGQKASPPRKGGWTTMEEVIADYDEFVQQGFPELAVTRLADALNDLKRNPKADYGDVSLLEWKIFQHNFVYNFGSICPKEGCKFGTTGPCKNEALKKERQADLENMVKGRYALIRDKVWWAEWLGGLKTETCGVKNLKRAWRNKVLEVHVDKHQDASAKEKQCYHHLTMCANGVYEMLQDVEFCTQTRARKDKDEV